MHGLGFVLKGLKKRLVKANETKREACVAEYATLRDKAQGKIFFVDETHVRADAELRGESTLKGKHSWRNRAARQDKNAIYYSAAV